MGVNLDENGAFVNMINHTNRYSNFTSFDSLGWPKSDFDLVLIDGRPAREWAGTIDDPEQYRVNYSGRYKCSFSGVANVTATGTSVSIENKNYDTASNISYFDLIVGGFPSANHGLVLLNFSNTGRNIKDTSNKGITELKVFKPGYELNTTKIFTDEFLKLCNAADFSCYRFYNLQNIWDGEPTFPKKTTWEMRKTPRDASQKPMTQANGKSDGWSWEYIVQLANILKKDIWINIHISCDSVYVSNLAKFLMDSLDSTINIYVENSNEVWSPTQASHGPYNKAEADYNKISFDQNYARRVVELSNWFALVFGKNEINRRIRVILAGQQSYNGRSDIHFDYIKKTFGEPKDFIYASSTSLYFGSTKASSTDPLVINDGMKEDIYSQISDSKVSAYRLNHINKAKKWGLTGGCTSYEGGPGIPAGGATTNLDNQILSNRTSKMGDVLKLSYLDGWKNLDGGLALYFTLNTGYNRYGCWGLTDDYTNPDRNFKMQAVRDIISSYSDVSENGIFNEIQIFPNPAADEIKISCSDFNHTLKGVVNSNIAIYNVFGEKVINLTPTLSIHGLIM